MSLNTRNRIRIECDLANQYKRPLNRINGKSPEFPSKKTCRVDLVVYDGGVFQQSILQFDSVTFELMALATRTGARIVTKTVSSASFASGISESAWRSGTEQHVTFEMTAGEMSAFSLTAFEQTLWMAITGNSADGNVTMIAGAATAIEDGGVYAGASAPAAGEPGYLTDSQTLAAIAGAVENKRILSKDGLYEVIIDVIDGVPVFHARTI